VETQAQLDAVRGFGELAIQGFYFSKAVQASEALSLVRSQPWRGQHDSLILA
jgi:EAL domain-containing protein (putative c-di-GMP-specific phosphodiesterase class I)